MYDKLECMVIPAASLIHVINRTYSYLLCSYNLKPVAAAVNQVRISYHLVIHIYVLWYVPTNVISTTNFNFVYSSLNFVRNTYVLQRYCYFVFFVIT